MKTNKNLPFGSTLIQKFILIIFFIIYACLLQDFVNQLTRR